VVIVFITLLWTEEAVQAMEKRMVSAQ